MNFFVDNDDDGHAVCFFPCELHIYLSVRELCIFMSANCITIMAFQIRVLTPEMSKHNVGMFQGQCMYYLLVVESRLTIA